MHDRGILHRLIPVDLGLATEFVDDRSTWKSSPASGLVFLSEVTRVLGQTIFVCRYLPASARRWQAGLPTNKNFSVSSVPLEAPG